MKRSNKLILTLAFATVLTQAFAQNTSQGVSIANDQVPPSPNAMLDVVSTEKGVLIPRVSYATLSGTLAPANIVSGEDGLMVYVTDAGSNHGFWYFDETSGSGEWVQLLNVNAATASSVWTENTNYSGNIYYQTGTVMVNGNANPTDPEAQLNLDVFPLQVFTEGNDLISVKLGGGGTTHPVTGQGSAHLNEINCDETSLDLQFWNGNTVNVGSGTENADLNVTGLIYSGGSLVSSDSTLKTRIQDLSGSYKVEDLEAKFKNLKLYSYELKSRPGVKQYGVVAQELENLFPDVVKNHEQVMSKGLDGSVKAKKNIKVVDYQALSIFSIALVKDLLLEKESQQDRIDTLEQQVQDLLRRVETLEK